jgi:hypothetical protein
MRRSGHSVRWQKVPSLLAPNNHTEDVLRKWADCSQHSSSHAWMQGKHICIHACVCNTHICIHTFRKRKRDLEGETKVFAETETDRYTQMQREREV